MDMLLNYDHKPTRLQEPLTVTLRVIRCLFPAFAINILMPFVHLFYLADR